MRSLRSLGVSTFQGLQVLLPHNWLLLATGRGRVRGRRGGISARDGRQP